MQLSWLLRGLRTGIVTTRYPHAAEALPSGFRGRPVLDPTRCRAADGCTACAAACLPGAITLRGMADVSAADGEAWTDTGDGTGRPAVRLVLNYGACIMCGLCVAACPTGAMAMTADYELAVRRAADLVYATTLALNEG
ncbi:MAG TPA: 4Fe-4S dicluster domain-containing protein [Isosphaeraceae bacterium]|nr:4Fe-4S dicluster domain-containing protein [Isosphaeraceae bacterium]